MSIQEDFDLPPSTGHAIPQWLRDQFDSIEMDTRRMGADGVFTQMRTKVQAYFEMLRSIERSKAGKDMYVASLMLEALQNLENDAGQIPDHAWNLVQNAIKKATRNQ